MNFMSEPVTVLHNVNGGAGIMATYVNETKDEKIRIVSSTDILP